MELPNSIDKEVVPLCTALNKIPGVQTLESCCGHGKGNFRIFFYCDDMETLYKLTCLIGPPWFMEVCGGSGFSGNRSYFALEYKKSKGESAYAASYELAMNLKAAERALKGE